MDVNEKIKIDFEYDLSTVKFSFVDLIINSDDYRKSLLLEFAKLKPEPKLHWYFNEFISDDVWERNCLSNKGPVHKSSDRGPVMANFIADTEVDKQASKIISDFDLMKRRNEVPERYHGRFIVQTETVKILENAFSELDMFRKYVLHNQNVDSFLDFAKTFTKRYIRGIRKIAIPGLQIDLLNHFLDITDEDIRMHIFFMNIGKAEQKDLFEKFKILKAFADELIIEEVSVLNRHIDFPTIQADVIIATNHMPDFRSQFLDIAQYKTFVDKLIESKRVRIEEACSKFILMPTRKGAKYEAVTIFEAAKELGYLRKTPYTSSDIKEILANTFLDWDLSLRTIGDFKTRKKIEYYMTILR